MGRILSLTALFANKRTCTFSIFVMKASASSLIALLALSSISRTGHSYSSQYSDNPGPPSRSGVSPLTRREMFGRIVSAATVSTASAMISTAPVNAEQFAGTSSVVIPGSMAPYRPQGIGSWKDIPTLTTNLGKSRILASELSPLQQAFVGEKELYYPPFLFGVWSVRAELKRKIFPYGIDYLPSSTLLNGSPRNREELVGNVCNYTVHYFSTLPNTSSDQPVINLDAPESKILQDRAYNAISLSKAYEQLVPVQEVTWDYRKTPEKVVLDFGAAPLTADMQPLGSRRAEIFLNARNTEANGNFYATAERSRSVTVAVRDVLVADTETITEFEQLSDGHVRGVSRIAVYLTPSPNSREGVLWQQTGGKAIAFFDYELDMNRIKEDATLPDDSTESRACVTTPQDVLQCA